MNKTNSAKQPIFIITKESFDSLFNVLRNHTSFPSRGFGAISSKEDFNKALNKIKFDKNNEALVSDVIKVLDGFESYKLVPGLNSELDKYKAKVRALRKNKKSSLQQI